MNSCIFVPYIQQPTHVFDSSATFIVNIFMNSFEFFTALRNILCQLGDHQLQFLVLKDFMVSYRSRHEQIFKRIYTFFNNSEFKNRISQIDCKTLNNSHDVNSCFEKSFNILSRVWMTMDQSKNYQKRSSLSIANHGFIIICDILCASRTLAL